jgi:alkylation response protein AidB-like acyl-CoA dehydrogenase
MPAELLADVRLPAALREHVAGRASAVDACTASPRPALAQLAEAGLLTLGAPGHAGLVAEQAAVLAELGESCLATAFSAWGHRMALEYLAPRGDVLAEELAAFRRPGCSAMAAAFKAHVGLGPLPVTARVDGDEIVLDGRIPWASNLYDDAVIVLAADLDGEAVVVSVPVGTPGLTIKPARELLALEATASGALVFDGARVPRDAVSDESFADFATRVRRPFLALQSAFCVGIARAALAAAERNLEGIGAEFADDHAALRERLDDVTRRLATTADDPSVPIRAFVQLRLDAATVAREAVRVEAAVTGGRGYIARSDTARRLREVAFLPVQSPTEAQLRWELRRSA